MIVNQFFVMSTKGMICCDVCACASNESPIVGGFPRKQSHALLSDTDGCGIRNVWPCYRNELMLS